jgi:predicted DNA-binding transcriptional regulator YafY
MLTFPGSSNADSVSPLVRPQRLLKLVSLLESKQALDSAALASALNVCKRTVLRDIKLLRSANIPISYDLTLAGYRLRRDAPPAADPEIVQVPDSAWVHNGGVCRCPKILADEIAALLLALRVAGQLPESIVDACESAIAKIMAAALPAARERAVHIMQQACETGQLELESNVFHLRPSG